MCTFWMLKYNTHVKVFMVPLRETILSIVAMPLIRERRVRGMLNEIKPPIYHSRGNVGGLLSYSLVTYFLESPKAYINFQRYVSGRCSANTRVMMFLT